MKSKGLGFKFAVFFICIAIVTVFVSSVMTYLAQTESYHEECKNQLKQYTNNIVGRMEEEGDEILFLKEYFEAHKDEVKVSPDFAEHQYVACKEYYDYMGEHFPEELSKYNPDYDKLDDKAKALYASWRMEYWFSVFFDAMDDFNLSYMYFIYPSNAEEHKMCYMFDVSLATKTAEDGTEVLSLGDEVFEDPQKHTNLWKTWEEGKDTGAFDILNNEYGYVYIYTMPVIINGEKVGVLCADLSVERVTSTILNTVVRQVVVLGIIMIIATLLMYVFVRRQVLKRIIYLEKSIKTYSVTKDSSTADRIKKHETSGDEVGSLANEFAGMINELTEHMINLQRVTAEKERIGAELSVATHIQADMLPRIFPVFPDWPEIDVYATMTPAKEVGGDFYDFFKVDERHAAMVIADVSSKGVPAALFMVIAKTLIKNCAQNGSPVAEVLRAVNDQLCEGNDEGMFVTAFLAVIDIETGDMEYVNAGHEPFLHRHNGEWSWVNPDPGFILAGLPGFPYESASMKLTPGDRLYMFTDGVSEAQNSSNELFGEERLLEAIKEHGDKNIFEMLPDIRGNIDAFVGEAPQFDDITMLTLEFRGKAE
ncbi:MAG: SpoIIE family protein phosphatase [Lachnospiraceae bacterium]|nr:SpoIIE family protein phosphatase [Lachnospiraceae bacterium]